MGRLDVHILDQDFFYGWHYVAAELAKDNVFSCRNPVGHLKAITTATNLNATIIQVRVFQVRQRAPRFEVFRSDGFSWRQPHELTKVPPAPKNALLHKRRRGLGLRRASPVAQQRRPSSPQGEGGRSWPGKRDIECW